jgi:2-oxoglutarate ferredoxin oxidoreductase subunit gamma
MRREIRIAGFGGQGVVLAGYVLGKALALYADWEAVMTQSHGPEARGGASSADLVVSQEAIAYPFVQQPDILVALSQEAYTKFRPTATPEALILIDEDLVKPVDGDQIFAIPATRLAEDLGRRIVANVVMLGYFTYVTGLVDAEAMRKALETTVKPKFLSLNLNAFRTGFEYQAGVGEDIVMEQKA